LTTASWTVFNVARSWREKVVNREFDFAKGIARVVGRVFAMLFRYAKIVNGD